MKTSRQVILSALLIFSTLASRAQIQQAWVARYNNGIASGTNQAVKIALDSTGNIYVTGSSQNTNQQIGYVTIKYAANGNPLWTTRFDSTNYPMATSATLALDSNNNSIVTGSALTIKYDPNGNQLWTVPYAGTAMALDSSGDAYVTGFGTNFNTVKLSPAGSNLWLALAQDVGPTVGESIAVDTNGNAYVAGSDTYQYYSDGGPIYSNVALLVIKYGTNGNRVWGADYFYNEPPGVQVGGMALDAANDLYLVAGFKGTTPYVTVKFSESGGVLWSAFPASNNGYNTPWGLLINTSSNVLLVGQVFRSGQSGCSTIELNTTNGATMWANLYPAAYSGFGAGMAMALDSANNCYVTGYSPGTNSSNDIVTIKYGPNGNQIWLQRYSSPGGGNAAGNAIAVDNNGNVYLTGYDTTAAGGTEMVTIKYSPLVLQIQTNGTALIKAQGFPGENFNIEASADLQTWLDIGSAMADTNGLMQYTDTNASNYPARFYYTTPQ